MSVIDADLLEQIFHNVSASVVERSPRYLEWGSGLSSLTFTRSLADAGSDFNWITLEHNREFMLGRVVEYLKLWSEFTLFDRSRGGATHPLEVPERGIVALVYDGGVLTPFLPGCEDHRLADLDAYVHDPARLGGQFDAIFVDGRKRRRCLLEARNLIADGGVVLLHDAFRTYYQCAWQIYPSWRRIGEELWIGAADAAHIDQALSGCTVVTTPGNSGNA
ncbi:hypothetical protein [Nocardia gipuzkoensis]